MKMKKKVEVMVDSQMKDKKMNNNILKMDKSKMNTKVTKKQRQVTIR